MSGRLAAILGVVTVISGALVYFLYSHGTTDRSATLPSIHSLTDDSGVPVPTAQYLVAHPAALQAGISSCTGSSAPSNMQFCDQVHRAQALVMAQKYRDAASRPVH